MLLVMYKLDVSRATMSVSDTLCRNTQSQSTARVQMLETGRQTSQAATNYLTWFLLPPPPPPSGLHRAVQRQDLATMCCLLKLGADPLLKNSQHRNPLQMLALKVQIQ